MKKILTIGILCLMLSITFVTSAKYDFDYNKPSLDGLSNQAFQLATVMNAPIDTIKLVYELLTISRFYENKLYSCEEKLQKQYARSCGGTRTKIVYVEVEPEEDNNDDDVEDEIQNSNGDANGDGVVDATDYIILKRNFGKTDCESPTWCDGADFNHDSYVDTKDLSILSENM